ncbi:dienelactone hydrolase family protein [Candidatus Binatia bacterium]|nr:dienelactone hydrolase family protein [Candidatus Binatia bacterium]
MHDAPICSRSWLRRLPALLVLPALLAACSDSGSGTSAAPYRDAGPYVAGVTTLDLGDRKVEVWYPVDPGDQGSAPRDAYYIRDWLPDYIDALLPADVNPPLVTDAYRDVPASKDGPFPLVLFAHGFAAFRDQSTFLTAHLASWGFVVAAPDYLERGLASALGQQPQVRYEDVQLSRATVDLLKGENARAASLLAGIVSAERVAIVGHSAGGGSAILFGGEPDVVTFVPMSAGARGAGRDLALPDKPSLWLTGAADGVVPIDGVEQTYDAALPPKRLVVLENAGHLAPSDLCAIGASGGGIVAIAIEAGLPVPEQLQRLGTDGCQPEALDPADGWPVVKHFVTAQLRWAFGIDPRPVGLSQDAAAGLPEAPFSYDEAR